MAEKKTRGKREAVVASGWRFSIYFTRRRILSCRGTKGISLFYRDVMKCEPANFPDTTRLLLTLPLCFSPWLNNTRFRIDFLYPRLHVDVNNHSPFPDVVCKRKLNISINSRSRQINVLLTLVGTLPLQSINNKFPWNKIVLKISEIISPRILIPSKMFRFVFHFYYFPFAQRCAVHDKSYNFRLYSSNISRIFVVENY